MQLGSMLGAGPAGAPGCCIPPCPWFPASTPGTTTMLASPQQDDQHERRGSSSNSGWVGLHCGWSGRYWPSGQQQGLRPETPGAPKRFATPVSLVPFLSNTLAAPVSHLFSNSIKPLLKSIFPQDLPFSSCSRANVCSAGSSSAAAPPPPKPPGVSQIPLRGSASAGGCCHLELNLFTIFSFFKETMTF